MPRSHTRVQQCAVGCNSEPGQGPDPESEQFWHHQKANNEKIMFKAKLKKNGHSSLVQIIFQKARGVEFQNFLLLKPITSRGADNLNCQSKLIKPECLVLGLESAMSVCVGGRKTEREHVCACVCVYTDMCTGVCIGCGGLHMNIRGQPQVLVIVFLLI